MAQNAYLPPEIWHNIFLQHTHPDSLWMVGRQVCSTWRSEIPKVFAKKYLEDPEMVQTYFDCGTSWIEEVKCRIGIEMIFDRYEGNAKDRCVFAENPLTTGSRMNSGNCDNESFTQLYEREKSRAWRDGLEWYLGADPDARAEGGRFDLTPHQVRVKSKANDTELPKLEFDPERREISFEWKGMFDAFYSEAARQDMRERVDMAETLRWYGTEDGSIVRALAFSKRNKADRRSSIKDIRRERIKKWHLENYEFEFGDYLFEEEAEVRVLDAIEEFEMKGDFICCAEDTEAKQLAKSHAEWRYMYDTMEFMRGVRDVREDDEAGLVALFRDMRPDARLAVIEAMMLPSHMFKSVMNNLA